MKRGTEEPKNTIPKEGIKVSKKASEDETKPAKGSK